MGNGVKYYLSFFFFLPLRLNFIGGHRQCTLLYFLISMVSQVYPVLRRVQLLVTNEEKKGMMAYFFCKNRHFGFLSITV